MLVFVRSLREGSFSMYLDSLTELAKWFHAMDHTHCERSVFVRRTVILFTYIFCGCSGISGNVSRAFFYFEFFFLSLGPFL